MCFDTEFMKPKLFPAAPTLIHRLKPKRRRYIVWVTDKSRILTIHRQSEQKNENSFIQSMFLNALRDQLNNYSGAAVQIPLKTKYLWRGHGLFLNNWFWYFTSHPHTGGVYKNGSAPGLCNGFLLRWPADIMLSIL